MILEFSVTNFRSIHQKQTISFIPVRGINEHPEHILHNGSYEAVNSIALYGRNAAGKSNLLIALKAFSILVKYSTNNKIDTQISQYKPFQLSHNTQELQPTIFEIDFVAYDGIRYSYRVSFNNNEILSERLLKYNSTKPTKLFERESSSGNSIKFGSGIQGEKNSLKRQILRNQLALSKGANSNMEDLIPPFKYISSILGYNLDERWEVFNFENDRYGLDSTLHFRNTSYMHPPLPVMQYASEDQAYSLFVSHLVNLADTGIESLNFRYEEHEQQGGGKQITAGINALHLVGDSNTKISFKIDEESQGTRNLISMSLHIYHALRDGSLLLIDEIDRGLHHEVISILIVLFQSKELNPNGAQLLFTTHDILLMDSKKFRRDEIWFAEKANSETTFYSIADFEKINTNISYHKWYQHGKFGATPKLGIINKEFLPL
ncbi:MAG: ATP-binding protein [Candidatus Kapaibacterium sp.]